MYEVIFYTMVRGDSPVDEFLDRLQVKVRAKVLKWIEQLEREGPDLPRPYADVVKGKIRELRIVFGSNQYRLLYFFCGKRIVITHGFVKKTDKVPEPEMARSQKYMNDYLVRHKREL